MVAPLVYCGSNSYPAGWAIVNSAPPHAFIHWANEFDTHWGNGFTCGAQVSTTFGRCGWVTRQASRMGSNILSTLVPMFCTEMDGIEPLQNVVVILASNRADLIDPAILRPGRIDRKIRVRRPDRQASQEIYKIYLTDALPLAEDRDSMVERIVEAHYAKTETNRFLDVTYRSGRHDYLYRGDLASGAIIAAIVERAKEFAIKRSIVNKSESPIIIEDLFQALQREYRENDLFPPSDITEDWLKLTDFDPGNVVRLAAYRTAEKDHASRTI